MRLGTMSFNIRLQTGGYLHSAALLKVAFLFKGFSRSKIRLIVPKHKKLYGVSGCRVIIFDQLGS